MYNYRLTIAYDGQRYKGWQRLANSDKAIQGKIEQMLSKNIGEPIKIFGASRTDAGVHAKAQVANFFIDKKLDVNQLKLEMNQYLPEDIRILSVVKASDRFHSRHNAVGKRYIYQVWNDELMSPFARGYYLHEPIKLDIDRMKKVAEYFIGPHDFTTFTTANTKKKSMIREVTRIDILAEGEKVFITVEGTGFLHNQVRRMVGVLIEIGTGLREPACVKELIEIKDRSKCGVTAPAHGLFLDQVFYD